MLEDDKLATRQAMDKFKTRIINLVNSKFPIESGDKVLTVENLQIKEPDEFNNITAQHELKIKNGSMYGSLRGVLVVTDKKTNKIDKSGLQTIIKIPFPTPRGTYIIGGNEKSIASQIRSKPGIYTAKTGKAALTTVTFDTKSMWTPSIKFSYNSETSKLKAHIGRINMDGIEFLTDVADVSESEIRNTIKDPQIFSEILDQSKKNRLRGDIGTLYSSLFSDKFLGTKEQIDTLRQRIFEDASFGEKGADVVRHTTGIKTSSLNKPALLGAISKTINVAELKQDPDNRDDLRFKQIVDDKDFIIEQIENGLNDFIKRSERGLQSTRANKPTDLLGEGLRRVNKSVESFMSGNSDTAKGIVENPEETNSLHLIAGINKVTQLGGKYGLTEDTYRNMTSPRNLENTAITRIDPVETPESSKIGLSEHLARNARIENGEILSKYFRVLNGSFQKEKTIELSPSQEYDKYVAFYIPVQIENKGGSFKIKGKTVTGRYQGNIAEIPVEKIQYIDTSASDILGFSAALVPFGSHNDGSRMMMGSNMQKQTLTLVRDSRENPLVQSAVDESRTDTFEKLVGEKSQIIRSPIDGTVIDVLGNKIVIKDKSGKKHDVEIHDYFPLNQANFINNEPVVNAGDTVKKGQLIADGWQTKNGELAIGTNARVGYMPFKGYNYEDGIVISESFANKVRTEEVAIRKVIVKDNQIGGPGSKAKDMLLRHTSVSSGLGKLDDDGIIKKGEIVGPGDIIVAKLKEAKNDNMDALDRAINVIMSGGEPDYNDASERIGGNEYIKGQVLDVSIVTGSQAGESGAKYVISIRVKTEKTLKLGDKLSGRHGNKGTITKILSDNEMPKSEDNRPLDLIFSPLAVPSRKNIGQLLEVNAGLIAEKEGKPFKAFSFDSKDKELVAKKLKEIGIPDGKMKMIDPDTGKPYENPVTVGNMYILKLKHKVDDKLQARSGIDGKINQMYLAPEKSTGEAAGEKMNPQRLGEMEMWALQSHGAAYNILEATTLKGDGAGNEKDRKNIFRALASKNPFSIAAIESKSGVPESLNILKDRLMSTGFAVTPMNDGKKVRTFDETFGELAIAPAKDADLLKIIGKENKIENSLRYKAKDDSSMDHPEKGGLYDPDIFGGDSMDDVQKSRRNWGYIELGTPMPNPILLESSEYNPYKELTGFSADQLKKIMNESVVVITSPGDSGLGLKEIVNFKVAEDLLIEGKNFEWKAGGEAILHFLNEVDVNKEIKKIEKELRDASGADRDKLYKKYRMLESLKKNKLEPKDLMNTIIPVTPRYLRPRIQEGSNVSENGMTTLYSNLIHSNDGVKETFESFGSPKVKAEITSQIYSSLKNLDGIGTPFKNKAGADIGGSMTLIGGKNGLVRDRMLGKRVDYSGRSVIGVDPSLKLNEVGLPSDIATKVYKPFIIKKLIDDGYAKNEEDANIKIKAYDADTKKVLNQVVKDRPVLINRAPTLHKFSIQAFTPIIKEEMDNQVVRNIHLNPLVVTGLNADFDGDQVAVHIPLSEKANKEAKKLMMPSDNLINPTDGSMIIEIRHEMALGVYYLTMNPEKAEGTGEKFSSHSELLAAYEKGDILTRDTVTLNGKTTTAGQWLFFGLIPEPYRSRYYGNTMAKKEIRTLLREMYDDIVEGKNKMSKIDLSNIIDNIKDIGFLASTKSGLSVGINDFTIPDKEKKDIVSRIKEIDKEVKNDESMLIAKYKELEDEVVDGLNKGMLGNDNPVSMMMTSGARGDAGVIRRIGGLVGIGKDVNDNLFTPIKSSHIDGLDPSEFWSHGKDARKGMYDRSVSTSVPGALTRELWSVNQDAVLSEEDCKTKEGIMMLSTGKIVGRYAAKDIVGSRRYVKAGEVITRAAADEIAKDEVLKKIEIRSPATCKTVKGVCQKCYGWESGGVNVPSLGTAVGVISAQAFGEPTTQMTMNTFHKGGTSTDVTLGLPRIIEILDSKTDITNRATLSQISGTVESISDKHGYTEVIVSGVAHKVFNDSKGNKRPIKVKVGDMLNKGQFITYGDVDDLLMGVQNITSASAKKDILGLSDDPRQGLRDAQEYMINSMKYTIDKSLDKKDAIDSRHVELTIGKLTENVKIIDPSSSHFMPGQTVKVSEVDRWNDNNTNPFSAKNISTLNAKDIVGSKSAKTYKGKSGTIVREGEEITQAMMGDLMTSHNMIRVIPKPVTYEASLQGTIGAPDRGHDNWLSNLGHRDTTKQVARGAAFGQVDKLEDPRARLMTGKLLNVGDGFNVWNKAKDIANSFSNSLINMFRK